MAFLRKVIVRLGLFIYLLLSWLWWLRIRFLCWRIARLWRRLLRLQRSPFSVDLNRQIYYQVQRRADTIRHKISAADTSRVLQVLREVLREQTSRNGHLFMFQVFASFVADEKPGSDEGYP